MATFPDFSPQNQRQALRIATDLPLHSWNSYISPPDSSSSANQSLSSSGTTPSTGTLEHALHVLCMYDFHSPDPDHLCFSKDEVLSIIKREESGWWAAMRPHGDRIGWIPGSFVHPLTLDERGNPQTPQDHSGVVEYSNETSWRPLFDDPPHSAIYDSWVRVSEHHKAQSFQLVTPTDLVPDFLPDVNEGHASFVDLSDAKRFSSLPGESRLQPPTPHTPFPQSARSLHFPPSPRSPLPLKARADEACLRHHPRPRTVNVDDPTSLYRPTKFLDTEPATPDRIIELCAEPPGASRSAPAPQECSWFPASPCANFSNSDLKALPHNSYSNLTIWNPNHVAQYLCVSMHALYVSIRQDECFMWIKERSSEHSSLRHFFDAHGLITRWVQKSILMRDDLSRRTEALCFWIRVAEKCLDLRNHDTLGAITSALTGVPVFSLGSTWLRCTQKQAFINLSDTVDISNNFNGLINIMDSVDGPSIPFVSAYLDHVKSLDIEHSDHRHSDDVTDAVSIARRRKISDALTNMLRHQSVYYNFEVAQSTRKLIDDQLQDVGWVTSSWLRTRSQDIQKAELGGSQN